MIPHHRASAPLSHLSLQRFDYVVSAELECHPAQMQLLVGQVTSQRLSLSKSAATTHPIDFSKPQPVTPQLDSFLPAHMLLCSDAIAVVCGVCCRCPTNSSFVQDYAPLLQCMNRAAKLHVASSNLRRRALSYMVRLFSLHQDDVDNALGV